MAADVILRDDAIELVDAQIVRIQKANGSVHVTIHGKLTASTAVQASSLAATTAVLGGTAASERPVVGKLTVKSTASPASDIVVSNGRVTAPIGAFAELKTAKVTVGKGTANEHAADGLIHVNGARGTLGVRIDGSGDVRLIGLGSVKDKLRNLEQRIRQLERG